MKYYIAENGKQVGPIEEGELLSHGMTVNTLVWRDGMPEWLPAGKVPELAYMFGGAAVPPQQPYQQQSYSQPPYPQQPMHGNQMDMPKTWLVESILTTIFCCLPFGIVGIIKASKVSSLYNSGDYAGAAEASSQAKKWTLIGVIMGSVWIILYILMLVANFGGVFGALV